MKLFLKLLFLIPLFVAASPNQSTIRLLQNNIFDRNEVVDYRVHYGFINAGEASMRVMNGFYRMNNKICYKAEVTGKSTGAFDGLLRIRDTWGAYFDTADNLVQKGYRNIEEGNYRLKEVTEFNYADSKATRSSDRDKDDVVINIPEKVVDMVSGYYYLRLIDYDRLKTDDIISLNAAFDKKLYTFKVRYKGKTKVKTKFGRINSIYLCPIMPENKLFDGESSIKFYMSDDANRIPVKIRAELFVGAVELDIKGYSGLRNPIKFD